MPETARSRLATALSRTRGATGLALSRWDARAVFGVSALAYLLAYLYALGHLAPGFGGFEVFVVEGALSKLFQPALGPLSFRTVARISLGPVTYLFSLNTLLGAALAVLVGLNLALTYLAWTRPAACGLGESSTALLAPIPALLSGTACCGPVVLLAFGVQASGVLLTGFQLLVPAAVVLLLVSLVLVGRQIRPAAAQS